MLARTFYTQKSAQIDTNLFIAIININSNNFSYLTQIEFSITQLGFGAPQSQQF